MPRRLVLVLAFALVSSLIGPVHATHDPYPGNADYSVRTKKLDRSLACSPGLKNLDGSAEHQPVLLVHGTFVGREHNWSWNYWPQLQELGREVCWVNLPAASLNDIQVSSEYVARAIQVMHRRTGEKVDVLGHSQGGLQPRWAIRFFPSGRFVDDYIGLASPNHGTAAADLATAFGRCFEACWQMSTTSRFMAALNAGDETPGRTDYTNIYTGTDELVQPAGTQALDGGTNVLLQDLCPERPVDHVSIAADGLTYMLVIDAMEQPGPTDPARLPEGHCQATTMPGSSAPPPMGLPEWSQYTDADREPRLKSYAR